MPKAKHVLNMKMLYVFSVALAMGLLQRWPVTQIVVICGMQLVVVVMSLIALVLNLTVDFNPFNFKWELYSESAVRTSTS